jgi:hypothetical protein
MIETVYYNDKIRCYRNGDVERFTKGKKWKIVKCESKNTYSRVAINRTEFINISRLLSFCFLGLEDIDGRNRKINIDHIDRDTKNNNINNLRVVTFQQNMFNKSGKGYSFDGKKYIARIRANKKYFYLGRYDTEEEAKQAYKNAKLIYHKI